MCVAHLQGTKPAKEPAMEVASGPMMNVLLLPPLSNKFWRCYRIDTSCTVNNITTIEGPISRSAAAVSATALEGKEQQKGLISY